MVSELSSEPDAVADVALLTQPITGSIGAFPITAQVPAGWYAALGGVGGEISSNTPFGSLNGRYSIGFFALTDDVLSNFGIDPAASTADAVAGLLPALPELAGESATPLSEVMAFSFDNAEYAEFVYSNYDDFESTTVIIAFGLLRLGDTIFAVQSELYVTDAETDLAAFYQAHSIARAIISTIQTSEPMTIDNIDTAAIDAAALDTETTFDAWEDGTVITIGRDNRWSADNFNDGEISLYSNADQYGAALNSFNLDILRLDEELLSVLGLSADNTPAQNAEILQDSIGDLSGEAVSIVQPVQALTFNDGEAAEFVYTYFDGEYNYLDAVVMFVRDGVPFIGVSSLRVASPNELVEFYRGQSVARASLDSLRIN